MILDKRLYKNETLPKLPICKTSFKKVFKYYKLTKILTWKIIKCMNENSKKESKSCLSCVRY